jgi:hypothetical protein
LTTIQPLPRGLQVDENVDGLSIRVVENLVQSARHRWFPRIAGLSVVLVTGAIGLTTVALLTVSSQLWWLPMVTLILGMAMAVASIPLILVAFLLLVRLQLDRIAIDVHIGSQGIVVERADGERLVFPPDPAMEVFVDHQQASPELILRLGDRVETITVLAGGPQVEWVAARIRERVATGGDRSAVPEALRRVRDVRT